MRKRNDQWSYDEQRILMQHYPDYRTAAKLLNRGVEACRLRGQILAAPRGVNPSRVETIEPQRVEEMKRLFRTQHLLKLRAASRPGNRRWDGYENSEDRPVHRVVMQ